MRILKQNLKNLLYDKLCYNWKELLFFNDSKLYVAWPALGTSPWLHGRSYFNSYLFCSMVWIIVKLNTLNCIVYLKKFVGDLKIWLHVEVWNRYPKLSIKVKTWKYRPICAILYNLKTAIISRRLLSLNKLRIRMAITTHVANTFS